MKNNNHAILGLGRCIFYVVIIAGYFANIYKLCNNDFAAPIKEEVVRVVGICIAPVGVITGYLELNPEE